MQLEHFEIRLSRKKIKVGEIKHTRSAAMNILFKPKEGSSDSIRFALPFSFQRIHPTVFLLPPVNLDMQQLIYTHTYTCICVSIGRERRTDVWAFSREENYDVVLVKTVATLPFFDVSFSSFIFKFCLYKHFLYSLSQSLSTLSLSLIQFLGKV